MFGVATIPLLSFHKAGLVLCRLSSPTISTPKFFADSTVCPSTMPPARQGISTEPADELGAGSVGAVRVHRRNYDIFTSSNP